MNKNALSIAEKEVTCRPPKRPCWRANASTRITNMRYVMRNKRSVYETAMNIGTLLRARHEPGP